MSTVPVALGIWYAMSVPYYWWFNSIFDLDQESFLASVGPKDVTHCRSSCIPCQSDTTRHFSFRASCLLSLEEGWVKWMNEWRVSLIIPLIIHANGPCVWSGATTQEIRHREVLNELWIIIPLPTSGSGDDVEVSSLSLSSSVSKSGPSQDQVKKDGGYGILCVAESKTKVSTFSWLNQVNQCR